MAFLSRFLLWQMHFWMARLQEKNNQKKKKVHWLVSFYTKLRNYYLVHRNRCWYTKVKGLQYRTWLFWLGIQSGGTQASAPLCFLQLHVNSSKDFSFLGYIILISSECAQIYRALKLMIYQNKQTKTRQNNKPTNTFEILRTNYTG